MKKEEVSEYLKEMATLLELSGENPFKVKAYYDAGRIVLSLDDFDGLVKEKKLNKIKGIGPSISEFIYTIYEKGSHPTLEELKKKFNLEFLELLKIPNLGPKKLLTLQKELNITSIQDLKYAIYENRLVNLSGFGKKTQDKLKEAIKFYESVKGKLLLNEAMALEEKILKKYEGIYPVGQLRRRAQTIDCLEFLLKEIPLENFAGNLKEKDFVLEGEVAKFNFEGYSVKIYKGGENFYKKLFELTGSKEHIEKIEELGKIDDNLSSEEEIYERKGLDFIPPEMREGIGEIEIAKRHLISKVVDFKDILGAFHNHTIESDGASKIEDYIKVAREIGFKFIGIADHSRTAKYAGGLEKEELLNQIKEIENLSKENNFLIFSGIESDILLNGNLDYEDDVLSLLDYVVGSIHSSFNLSKEEQMARILKAISNKHLKIFGHPQGRILLGRKGYEVDIEKVLEKLAEGKKWIELNSNPLRLDLDFSFIPLAQSLNVPVCINPDAHISNDLKDVFYGVWMARKGILFKENCVNAWDIEKIKEELNYYEKRR